MLSNPHLGHSTLDLDTHCKACWCSRSVPVVNSNLGVLRQDSESAVCSWGLWYILGAFYLVVRERCGLITHSEKTLGLLLLLTSCPSGGQGRHL